MENKTLQLIDVKDIAPNPFNPRLVFDQQDLDELKTSIQKVGILVPLTVYLNTKNHPKEKYILLDGERRWRCAKEIPLTPIPANIIDEPEDVTQNILFMFNIHHFRKEWALFPTALKLEVVMEKLGTQQESVISQFTGVSRSMIRRCKTLLWFPKKYREILMEKGSKISTDFFIELNPIALRLSNEEEFAYPKGTERFVDGVISKFLNDNIITDVKEFREIRKSMAYFEKSNNFRQFVDKIEVFITDNKVGLDLFASPELDEDKVVQSISKYISYLIANLNNLNSNLISDFIFVEQLKALEKIIRKILEEID